MNDRERLEGLVDRIRSLEGLDEERFQRLTAELDRPEGRFGYDEGGRLKLALFDAKSYDIESFEGRNDGRFAIDPIEASLNEATAPAAEGHKVVCIFVNDTCDAKVAKALAALGVELVALRCAGFNNVDLAACRKRGLSVVRVPEYSPYAVAEHTVGLMLTLNRGLHRAYERNRAGYFVLEGLTGFDMRGKTVGVVGTGKIGRCTVDILLGFGCRVLAFDKHPNEELGRREGVEYVALERLWADSDIISLHVPLFPETHHLVNPSTIAQMKDGVMLINTSRGGLDRHPGPRRRAQVREDRLGRAGRVRGGGGDLLPRHVRAGAERRRAGPPHDVPERGGDVAPGLPHPRGPEEHRRHDPGQHRGVREREEGGGPDPRRPGGLDGAWFRRIWHFIAMDEKGDKDAA